MSAEVVSVGTIGFIVGAPVVLAGVAFVAVAGVAYGVAAGIKSLAEMEAERQKKLQEQQRREDEYKKEIVQRIEQYFEKPEIDSGHDMREMEMKSAQIRGEILVGLAADKQYVEKVHFSEESSQPARKKTQRTPDKHSRDDLLKLHRRLWMLDKHEAEIMLPLVTEMESDLPGRADAVAVQIKLALGRAMENFAQDILYRKELGAMLSFLGEQQPDSGLEEAFVQVLDSDALIRRPVFEDLARRHEETREVRQQENLAAAVTALLRQQGYEMYDDRGNAVNDVSDRCYVGLDAEGEYHAMIRSTPEGGLSVRLVRMVGDEKDLVELTEYQRQKDQEAAKKWCAYYKTLTDRLQDAGVPVQTTIVSDEYAELLVLVNKDLAVPHAAAGRRQQTSGKEFSRS
jgi:hypothetical protein